MKKTTWKIVAAIGIVASAVACGIALAMGGCDACVETVSGACVPMKCHWTFHAVAAFEALSAYLLLGLVFVACKMGRRWLAVGSLLCQLATFVFLYTPVAGLCAKADMACRATATACTPFAAIAIVVALIALWFADPKKGQLPKRGL